MSESPIYVGGVFVKKAPVNFFLIKGSICLEDLKEWVHGEGKPHVQKGSNGKHYINFDIKNGKESGEPYLSINTWKPEKKDEPVNEPQGEQSLIDMGQEIEPDNVPDSDDIPF
jgi:hypothetical protein